MSNQSDALQSFKIMALNYKGQALAGLITQVTSHPRIFQFTEILECPNFKNLAKETEFKKYVDQLNLFAYGNYSKWEQNKQNFPEFKQEHIKKLRQLTIVDLCIKNKILGYELLKLELNIDNDQEIDELLIDSIYEGIIQGKINQSQRVFKVSSVISRDLREEDIGEINQILENLYRGNKQIVETLSTKIQTLNDQKLKDLERQKRYKDEQNQQTGLKSKLESKK